MREASCLGLVRKLPIYSVRGGVIQAAPLAMQALVLLASVDVPEGGKAGGEIVALDRSSLVASWRMRHDLWYLNPFRALNDRLALYSNGTDVVALDIERRCFAWKRQVSGILDIWRGQPLMGSCAQPSVLDLVDAATGAVIDALEVPPGEPIAEALSDDTLVLGVKDDQGHASFSGYDLREKRLCWQRDLFADLRQQCGVDDFQLFETSPGSLPAVVLARADGERPFLAAFSAVDGEILWKVDLRSPGVPMAAAGKIVFPWDNQFFVIDERSGAILHDRELPIGSMYRVQKGSLYLGHAVFTGESGHIAVFDIEAGTLLWLGEYKAAFYGSAVVDDRILVPADDGNLWVYAEQVK